jgi:quinol monooxygenase YgiN
MKGSQSQHNGPVILINKFSVNPKDLDQFLKAWAAEAGKFKEQPGFISTQLHRGIGGSGTFVNYAVWESAAHFKKAVNNVMNPNDRMSDDDCSNPRSSRTSRGGRCIIITITIISFSPDLFFDRPTIRELQLCFYREK